MSREQSQALVEKLLEARKTGNRNSNFHAIFIFGSVVHRVCNHTLKSAGTKWQYKGLFVADSDFLEATTDHIFVLYEMACGALVYLIIKKVGSHSAFAKQIKTMGRSNRDGKPGFLVGLDQWTRASFNMQDLIRKDGGKLITHYAWKHRR